MQHRARANPKIRFILDTVVDEVLGSTDPETKVSKVTGLKIRNVRTGAVDEFPTDAVFVAIGHHPNTDIFKGQLPLDERGYALAVDGETTATAIDGIFVAGDVRDHR